MLYINELLTDLRNKRASLGLTQSQTAERVGISRQQMSRIDNGRVKFLHVKTIDAIKKFIETEEKK